MRYTVADIQTLSDGEFRRGLYAAAVVVLVTAAAFLCVLLLSLTGRMPIDTLNALGLVAFIGGMASLMAFAVGWRKAMAFGVVVREWMRAEIKHKFPDLETVSPLNEVAPEPERIPITNNVEQPELINGVDVQDLAFLCRFISRRRKWTAETLEGMELPNSHRILTNKDTRTGTGELKATTYAEIMKLFEDGGVITERAKGETGILAEVDPTEMLRKIRRIGVAR